jgi:hypothetical protein
MQNLGLDLGLLLGAHFCLPTKFDPVERHFLLGQQVVLRHPQGLSDGDEYLRPGHHFVLLVLA